MLQVLVPPRPTRAIGGERSTMPYKPAPHIAHPPPPRDWRAEGYTRSWRTLSEQVRQEQPWCSICMGTESLTVDHIIPRSMGGSNDRDNLQVLCRSCNSRKATRL